MCMCEWFDTVTLKITTWRRDKKTEYNIYVSVNTIEDNIRFQGEGFLVYISILFFSVIEYSRRKEASLHCGREMYVARQQNDIKVNVSHNNNNKKHSRLNPTQILTHFE